MIRYYGQYMAVDTEAEILTLTGKAGDVAFAIDTKLRYAYNGTIWMPNSVVQTLRSTVTIDGKTAASTLIFTLPPTIFRFVPLGGHIEILSSTGVLGVGPAVSVGTNSTAYNNLFTSSVLAALLTGTGVTQTNALAIASTITPLTNSAQIYAKVNTPATLFTAYTFQVDILGYYKV